MYPNLFLKTFWRTDLNSKIFVAMSFDDTYNRRFTDVIAPAIESIRIAGVPLKPLRVDLTKSGDSILTEIMEGIAHSEMILADISIIGHDSKTGNAYRNGNVMYEVGLALACRQSSEVLLIRDDKEKLLFDVSTIPHMHIDFSNPANACTTLQNELVARLNERSYINDARVKLAIATLSAEEKRVLEVFGRFEKDAGFGFTDTGNIDFTAMTAMPRLLDKQLIQSFAAGDDGRPVYRWTRLGYIVSQSLSALPTVPWNRPTETLVESQKICAGEGEDSRVKDQPVEI